MEGNKVTEYSVPRPTSLHLPDVPTAAETSLPWRRDAHGKLRWHEKITQLWFGCASDERGVEVGSPGVKSPLESSTAEVTRVSTPTALETLLPWKRTDDSENSTGIQQNEFPPWCSNKEYLAYNSPSATFLGGIEQPGVASVIGFFCRDSEPSSPIISSPTVLLIEEATSLLSPRSRAIARRGSLLELSNSVDPIQEEELLTISNGGSTPSLSDRWTLPRRKPSIQPTSHPLSPSVESLESSESGGVG